ncbi:MAG: hypothetical protein ACYC9Q_13825 [Bacillota bacterium]
MKLVVVILTLFGLATALWPGWLGPALLVSAGSLFVLGAGFSATAKSSAFVAFALAVIGLAGEVLLVAIARRRYGGDWRDLFRALAGGFGTLFVSGLLVGPLLGVGLWRSLGGAVGIARLSRGGQVLLYLIGGRVVKFLFATAAAVALLKGVFTG